MRTGETFLHGGVDGAQVILLVVLPLQLDLTGVGQMKGSTNNIFSNSHLAGDGGEQQGQRRPREGLG